MGTVVDLEASCAAVAAAEAAVHAARRRRNDEILHALGTGESMYSLARRVGMSETAVRKIRDEGMKNPSRRRNRP